jgi:hypothetical protein
LQQLVHALVVRHGQRRVGFALSIRHVVNIHLFQAAHFHQLAALPTAARPAST